MGWGGEHLFPEGERGCFFPAHAVQFYGGDVRTLTRGVCRYLEDGLRGGEAALVIATPLHRQAFQRQLDENGVDPERAIDEGRLLSFDAEETLALFMLNGQPHWEPFKIAIEALMAKSKLHTCNARVRAYGEMVDLLWNAGQTEAAARLEQFWNKLLAEHGFSLYCAYQIDIFGKEFHASVLDSVLCTHTHMLAADLDLEAAVDRGMKDVLGSRAEGMKELMKNNFRPAWAAIPKAEAKVLWIRTNLPGYADEILARARGYYQVGEARN